jgi:hypothetical protein
MNSTGGIGLTPDPEGDGLDDKSRRMNNNKKKNKAPRNGGSLP